MINDLANNLELIPKVLNNVFKKQLATMRSVDFRPYFSHGPRVFFSNFVM